MAGQMGRHGNLESGHGKGTVNVTVNHGGGENNGWYNGGQMNFISAEWRQNMHRPQSS